ncbi:hypothetical protein UPYG_G00275810 [Umbra pygmaea]|uniref:Pentraxin family member n=1 Tax=Umbra pygmaea TaxID=75934 RepID=A0ABD0W2Y6_UMBPY
MVGTRRALDHIYHMLEISGSWVDQIPYQAVLQLIRVQLKLKICVLVLVAVKTCCAKFEDLSGKMLTFPQESDTDHVRLSAIQTVIDEFPAMTVCLRFVTDLSKNHILFSLTTHKANAFLLKRMSAGEIKQVSKDSEAVFAGQEFTLNAWHSLCSTWASETGLGQLWLDGRPSARKYLRSQVLTGRARVVLGQELDKFHWHSDKAQFIKRQTFVGLLTDVHVWDYVVSPCEIQRTIH